MKWSTALLTTIGLGLWLWFVRGATTVQEPLPPDVGQPILEDALRAPGALQPLFCPTGRNSARFTDGAYRLQVTGRCRSGDLAAQLEVAMVGLTVPDGDVEVDVRVAAGTERSVFMLSTRSGANKGYMLALGPEPDRLRLYGSGPDGAVAMLAERDGLGMA